MVHIRDIKKCIEEGRMSFIIGAGFSKNVSGKFPLWKDLIDKLAKEELYQEDSAYCERMIAEKGYLGIASEYVRRKGYHEAIDLYIEKNMPYLRKTADGKFEVMLDGKVIDSSPSLDCHGRLLGLGAKHIYTFNYDNTLEAIAEIEARNDIDRQIAEKKEKCKELEAKRDMLDSSRTAEPLYKEQSIPDSVQEKTVCTDSEGNIQDERNSLDSRIAELKYEINYLKQKKREYYHLVTDGYQISMTEDNKNIYKLHGSLRTSDKERFGFDNDRHMQYVITEEDYRDYPEKHEPFVNLMKISLLKGCFCLLGFSGDDPDFLAWAGWVKDVLDKSHDGNSPDVNSERLYFINADPAEEPLTDSKKQFLRNNYITLVNLFEIFPEAGSREEKIRSFLEAVKPDRIKASEYEEVWRSIKLRDNNQELPQKVKEPIEKAYSYIPFARIPKQTGLGQFNRTSIFSKLSIDRLLKNNSPELCGKLYYTAIKGEMMPVNTVLRPAQYRRLQQHPNAGLKEKFRLLELRARVLDHQKVEDSSSDDAVYETVLSCLFSFDFFRTKRLLEDWKPSDGFNRMRKYALLSTIGATVQDEALHALLDKDNFTCSQDFRFAQDVLRCCGSTIWRNDVTAEPRQEVSLYRILDTLFSEVRRSPSAQAYGNVRRSFTFGPFETATIYSIKILQALLEFGIGPEIRNVLIIDKGKWVEICKNIFEGYPYQALFMTLLYGDSKEVVCKVAQDFIYSHRLYPHLPSLLDCMLRALEDNMTPENIKGAIYIAAPVFMKAVPPEKWSARFESIYGKLDYSAAESRRDRVNKRYDFITAGVRMSGDTAFRQKVILDALSVRPVTHFCNEMIISATHGDVSLSEAARTQLSELCRKDSISTPEAYIVYNLRKWLEGSQVTGIYRSLSDEQYNDVQSLECACWLAKEYHDGPLTDRMKGIVLDSPHLWNTGVENDRNRVSGGSDFIDINPIADYLGFNDSEILQIYQAMLKAYDDIAYVARGWGKGHESMLFFNDWRGILACMSVFLKNNKKLLSTQARYSSVKRDVTTLLHNMNGGSTISELLTDDSKTGNAIGWLVDVVNDSSVRRLTHEYILLTGKMLCKDSQYLNSCFKHFGWVLDKYQASFDRSVFKPILKSLLDTYKPYFRDAKNQKWDIQYAEKDVVEHGLITIYKVYVNWGGIIPFWDKYIPKYH